MTEKTKGDGRTVQLKKVRLSFADSLKDKKPTVENGEPKHSFNIILEKSSPHYEENLKKVISALKAASELAFKNPDAYKDLMADDPKRVCFRKGERFKNREGKPYAGYEGNYGIACGCPSRGQRRPQKMLDRHKRPVEVDDINDVFYNGALVDVYLSFYGTEKGGRGIFNTAEAIRSWQEGDRVGGGVYIDADDFDDADDDDDSFESYGSSSEKSSSSDLDLDLDGI